MTVMKHSDVAKLQEEMDIKDYNEGGMSRPPMNNFFGLGKEF
ncbi:MULTISPECIES: hypothetical protein [Paenibacillus]|nr:hypothetical protein [Paenibacillus anaericanus]